MKILVCNAGSTSLKFKLFDMPDERVLSIGKIERVGDENGGDLSFENSLNGERMTDESKVIPDYSSGINAYLEFLMSQGVVKDKLEISAVGFKSVLSKGHYGVHIIDEDVKQGMRDYMVIAPAHNRCYLQAIETLERLLPDAVRVGAFETAFHSTLKKEAYVLRSVERKQACLTCAKGLPYRVPIAKAIRFRMAFAILNYEVGESKGTACPQAGKNSSCGGIFSSPGWRSDCPSPTGAPLPGTKNKTVRQGGLFLFLF